MQIEIKHIKSWMVLFLALFSSFALQAQDVSFTAKANRTEVPLDKTFNVTYTIANANSIKSFTPPNFDPFINYGSSQQQSHTNYNGTISQQVSITYTLKPTKEGTFKVPSAGAILNGKNQKSNSVNIKVVAAGQKTQPQGNTQNNAQGNRQSQQNLSLEEQIHQNLHVRAIPNKTTVWEGEQINLSYKLLYRVTLQDIAINKSPSYDGFLSYDIELSDDKKAKKVEEYKGQRYNSSLFQQNALFPTSSGKFTLQPMELDAIVAVERPTRSFFRQYDQVEVTTKSNPLNITVKPLPSIGRPPSFTGAVGKYDFTVDYDKTNAQVDEPITLKIKISGTGNIKLLDVPAFELPQSFEVYDPKINEKVTKKSYTLGGSKTYEYVIIPRGGGEFQFPPIEFTYFDLASEKYVTKSFEGPLVNIEGEALAEETNINNISKEDVELLSTDIKFIESKLGKAKAKKNLIQQPIFFALTGLPLLCLLLLPILTKRRREEMKDSVLVKQKKASKAASKRLATAKQLMQSDDKAFYNEIVKSIWGYLGDKFNIPSADLSKANAKTVLADKNVSETTIASVNKLIDDCEMAIYAPGATQQSKAEVLQAAENLLNNLENEIA